jgi:hypothetical protein
MKVIIELENDHERRAFLVPSSMNYFAGCARVLASNYFARQFVEGPVLLTLEVDSGTFYTDLEAARSGATRKLPAPQWKP